MARRGKDSDDDGASYPATGRGYDRAEAARQEASDHARIMSIARRGYDPVTGPTREPRSIVTATEPKAVKAVRVQRQAQQIASLPRRVVKQSQTVSEAVRDVARPSVKADASNKDTLKTLGVRMDDAINGWLCRSANRPLSNKGKGGSRPFIPWCAKGKRK